MEKVDLKELVEFVHQSPLKTMCGMRVKIEHWKIIGVISSKNLLIPPRFLFPPSASARSLCEILS